MSGKRPMRFEIRETGVEIVEPGKLFVTGAWLISYLNRLCQLLVKINLMVIFWFFFVQCNCPTGKMTSWRFGIIFIRSTMAVSWVLFTIVFFCKYFMVRKK